jgi:hypothetical protein
VTLPEIRSKGIRAYCTDLIIDDAANVHLLSVAGHQVAVKGIVANVLEYGPASVYGTGVLRLEITRDACPCQVRYHRLPSGLYQAVVLPKMAFSGCREPADRFMVLCHDEPQELFFQRLQERTDIPLHPDWAGWLWQHMEGRGTIVRLETVVGHYRGYLVDLNRQNLSQAIADEIRKQNPVLLQCFEKEETR